MKQNVRNVSCPEITSTITNLATENFYINCKYPIAKLDLTEVQKIKKFSPSLLTALWCHGTVHYSMDHDNCIRYPGVHLWAPAGDKTPHRIPG